ncbi:MAG: histidine phosphotransferase family protein [Sphingopyxis sp.]
MADDAIDFASMMCSRLCHDLLSPVGSFGNGLELLADEDDAEMQKRCISLLESSSRVAINKLKFFRLAFGSAGGYGESIAAADIRDAIAGLIAEGRDVQINWIGTDAPVPKPAARILLLLALVVVEALVRGGRIDMAIETRGETLELAVRGACDRVVIDAASEAMFADADSALSPKTVPIALARRVAQGGAGDVMLSRPSAGEIVVGAIISA